MRRLSIHKLALVLCLLTGLRTGWAADAEPLVFGVFPYATARQIVETYRPVASALEKQLKRRVLLYTARDFKTFVERTRQGEYDILLTAPHLAWLAQQEAGYRPLLKYTQPVRGLLVVKADSTFNSTDALRGHTIAAADSFAVAIMAVQGEMARQDIQSGIDYRTVESGTHLNAVMQVLNGRADGAMLGMHAYMLMPSDVRQQLRVLIETPPLSSLIYLTHPLLPDAEAPRVRKALLNFAASPEGLIFMQRGGYGGLANVNDNEQQVIHPYALQAREMLRKTP